jgi:hypothetical protein
MSALKRTASNSPKGEKREAKLRRDIAGLGGRAFRSQRIFAREEHGEHPAAQRLEADVGVDVAKRQTSPRVENEAELRRQTAQALVLLEARLQRGDAWSEIERSFGIEVVDRAHDNVAQALDLGIGVEEPCLRKACMQIGQRALAQAPQVKIGARREADGSVAAATRGVRQRFGLIERQAPSRRAHPRQQPIAGLHWLESPRTPAFPIGRRRLAGGDRSHAASFNIEARMRALELRRESQKPRLAASSNTPAI